MIIFDDITMKFMTMPKRLKIYTNENTLDFIIMEVIFLNRVCW